MRRVSHLILYLRIVTNYIAKGAQEDEVLGVEEAVASHEVRCEEVVMLK